jgi:hypothetical protein
MTMTATRISTLLAGLVLTALSVSASPSPRPARPDTAPAAAPTRARHALVEEGCFVPPPEPVEVPPCDDRR